jgi:hypothetical protein
MKTKLYSLLIVLALIAGVNWAAAAEDTRFFRISGPAATTIVAFQPDGTLVWSNAQPGATYTIQTVSSLTGGSNWLDYVQIPTSNELNNSLLIVQTRLRARAQHTGVFGMGTLWVTVTFPLPL